MTSSGSDPTRDDAPREQLDTEPVREHEPTDRAALDVVVAELLGRRPQGHYEVAVTRSDGTPVVLVNDPFLDSGRPMPTRYWLVDPALNKAIGTLESVGGVKTAEKLIDPKELQASHDRYRRERDLAIAPEHPGPRPSGGVGGTRVGVKCLHAHYGYFLAGADDPVGQWVHQQLTDSGDVVANLSVVQPVPDDGLLVSPESDVVDGASVRRAFVELGSGSVKALIVEGAKTKRSRFVCDLLSGLDDNGVLSSDGRQQLTNALTTIAASLGDDHHPAQVVATAALRSRQSAEVGELVRELLHTDLEILTGNREAELGYRAAFGGPEAASADPGQPPKVSIDLGYASTEFATIGPGGDLLTMSLPIGSGTVIEKYLHSDPPQADELSAALSVIELHLDDIRLEMPDLAAVLADERADVVGLGAIRHVAEVELGRNEGDEINGYRMASTDVEEVFRALATESSFDRAANPGLRPEHVDWIVGAICVLVETMRQFGMTQIRACTAGLLDGLWAEQHLGSGAEPALASNKAPVT